MKKTINKKGFTLVELIVVIAIIGILAAVLIPSISGYIKKARFSSDQQDAANMTLIVNSYIAERGLKDLTAAEIKTIILTDGQYDLVPRRSEWTFVYNKSKRAVEALKFEDVGISAADSSTVTEPEEMFIPGYYIIGKGTTAVEKVIDEIRNFDGTKEITEILNQLTGSNAKFKTDLEQRFNPATTLFINENGTHTAAQETIATTSSKKIYKYEKVTKGNFSSTAMIFNYNSTSKEYEPVEVDPDLYYKVGERYTEWDKTSTTTDLFTRSGDEGSYDYKQAYIGIIPKTVNNVVFGDSIAFIPSFSDIIALPNEVKVPATIEFISEGAFIGVTSQTRLVFSGKVLFEAGFLYNDNMLIANDNIQPISSAVDYEKMGVTLFNVYLVNNTKNEGEENGTFEGYTPEKLAEMKNSNNPYKNGDFVQLVKGQNLMLDLDEVRSLVPDGKLNGLEVRMGFTEDIKFHEGFNFSDKFVAKLFQNGKLVGYCCVYYRNVTSVSHG